MFKKSLVVRAMAVAIASVTVSISLAPVAHAQSNATGTLFGTAPAGAADSVAAESLSTNAKRTATLDANGKFQMTSMPPGRYRVQLLKGQAVVSSTEVEERI